MGLFSKVKCQYCNEMIKESATTCPYCGAVNGALKRTAKDTPVTIDELHKWYKDHHLPPSEVTRYFIGINYTKPKAFGIYQDGINYVVYMNDASGNRTIFYEGPDEAYGVNEILFRLKNEILNQKLHQKK